MVSKAKVSTKKRNKIFEGDQVKSLRSGISSEDRMLGLKSMLLSNIMGNLGFFIKQTLLYIQIDKTHASHKTTMDNIFKIANDIISATSGELTEFQRKKILNKYLPLCIMLTHLGGYFDLVAEIYTIDELKDLRQLLINVLDDFIVNGKTDFPLIDDAEMNLFESEFVDFLDNFVQIFNSLMDKVVFATRLKNKVQSGDIVNNYEQIKQDFKNETAERIASLFDRFQLTVLNSKLDKEKEKLTEENIIEALKLYFGKRSNPKSDFFKGDFSNMGILRMGSLTITLDKIKSYIEEELNLIVSQHCDNRNIANGALHFLYLNSHLTMRKALEDYSKKHNIPSMDYSEMRKVVPEIELNKFFKPLAGKIKKYCLANI